MSASNYFSVLLSIEMSQNKNVWLKMVYHNAVLISFSELFQSSRHPLIKQIKFKSENDTGPHCMSLLAGVKQNVTELEEDRLELL